MIKNKDAFGRFFADAREKSGLSQLALAKKLGFSSPQYVSNWERGICGPPIEKLGVMSNVLVIKPEILLRMILNETEDYLRIELKLPRAKRSH